MRYCPQFASLETLMTPADIIRYFNQHRPACVELLGGAVTGFEPEQQQLTMDFSHGLNCCHSGNIIQGGFVTAMLDAAMAHAAMALEQFMATPSSIDINVSFLRPARQGRYRSVGTAIKLGRTVAYLRAELFDAQDTLVATATSSVYLVRHDSAQTPH